jgi:hypothetical protein
MWEFTMSSDPISTVASWLEDAEGSISSADPETPAALFSDWRAGRAASRLIGDDDEFAKMDNHLIGIEAKILTASGTRTEDLMAQIAILTFYALNGTPLNAAVEAALAALYHRYGGERRRA